MFSDSQKGSKPLRFVTLRLYKLVLREHSFLFFCDEFSSLFSYTFNFCSAFFSSFLFLFFFLYFWMLFSIISPLDAFLSVHFFNAILPFNLLLLLLLSLLFFTHFSVCFICICSLLCATWTALWGNRFCKQFWNFKIYTETISWWETEATVLFCWLNAFVIYLWQGIV